MKIALDYDGTYTRDPTLWNTFIALCTRAGHQVVCITMRHPGEAVDIPCPVVYTGRRAKAEFGLDVHVWIDNDPMLIYQGA